MINYLYIDDDSEAKVSAYMESLSNDELKITYKGVQTVNKKYFIDELKNYDGVLLDLRTDQEPDDDDNTSDFTGAEWGQHIRVLSTNCDLDHDLPIVLFSTDSKLRDTYFSDLTSNNIFDRFLTKDKTPINATQKLTSLAKGYKVITANNDFNTLLNINIKDLDERIFSRFLDVEAQGRIPVHEYAQMILKDLIYAKGTLINEKYLASRLGIDTDSSTDWGKIKTYFNDAKYTGVFSDGWDRWWMYKVDNIFEALSKTYLSYLDAKEKVNIFKDKLPDIANINYPEPIETKDGTIKNRSYRYWTMCKALKKPMDAKEGFRVYTRQEPKPWQEYEYVSLPALLDVDSLSDKDIRVHPLDKDKYFLARSKVQV